VKEIAAYLRRDVSAAQHWEKRERMPVHRHLHDKLGSVYAFRSELNAWTRSRLPLPPGHEPDPAERESDRSAMAGEAHAAPTEAEDALGFPRRRSGRRALTGWVLAAGALLLMAAESWWWPDRTDDSCRNPLENARFETLTDFGGNPQAAAISRDGRFVAFLSDRDGRMDV
jgi:hypothetical protein